MLRVESETDQLGIWLVENTPNTFSKARSHAINAIDHMGHLKGEIDRLAKWFLEKASERIIEGGAVDNAIALIEKLDGEARKSEADILEFQSLIGMHGADLEEMGILASTGEAWGKLWDHAVKTEQESV